MPVAGSDQRLHAAISVALSGAGPLGPSTQGLMATYRSGQPPAGPILSSATAAAAYAAYRMPATVAAIGAAVRQVRLVLPGWAPHRLLDLGAGTGAVAWAVAGELPTVADLLLLDQSPSAIAVGRAVLAAGALLPAATWKQWELDEVPDPSHADLVTVAYVLGELDLAQQHRMVDLAARSGAVVVLVEPGTPAGYRRILAARAQLLSGGLSVIAPCPHQRACPLAADGRDWCHFAQRVDRSPLQRRLKGADRSFEDEKFSFVAASRLAESEPTGARVLRRPRRRKGLVSLHLCLDTGEAQERLVSRRQGAVYRDAVDTEWGDAWPPGGTGWPDHR